MNMRASLPRRSQLLASLFYCSILCGLLISVSHGAPIVGSFDLGRGGINSLADFSGLAPFRSLIQSLVPGATFSSSNQLTSSYLSTVDILYLGALTTPSTPIAPLSASEQTALLNYVLGGGEAMIATDHSLIVDAPATYQSMLDSFGLATTGVLDNTNTATIVNPSHPIADGPLGKVTGFSTDAVGWYSSLGPYANALATYDENGQPILAVIERKAMSPTSGAVIFLSDLNVFDLALIDTADLTLVENGFLFLAVPEPASWALALAGLFPLLLSRKVRRCMTAVC